MRDSNSRKTSGITFKDKIGYAMGDVGSLLVFGLVNTFLQVFYTDKLGITPLVVMFIMIGARVWDAINDPIWGGIVDRAKCKPGNRYRKWLLYLCGPLAVSAIVMFLNVKGYFNWNYQTCVAFAIVTYIMFGMLYTGTNIPYGSMSAVITSDERERNDLSIYRSVGSMFGGFGAMIVNFFCWDNVIVDGKNVSELNSTKLIIGVAILAILSIVAYVICYFLSKERIIALPRRKDKSVKNAKKEHIIRDLFKTKSFLVVAIVGMIFLAAQMFQTTYNTYVFKNFFGRGDLATFTAFTQYIPIAIIMFFSGKLVKKFGRKEICAIGLLFTTISFAALACIPVNMNRSILMWIFIAFSLLAGFGNSFIFLMVWALANDAIDDYFVKYKRHNEGQAYSAFTFMRKLGQTFAAVIVNVSLISIGYGQGEGAFVPSEDAVQSMYYQSIIIPAALSLVLFLLLVFVYPLNKKKVAELQIEKNKILKNDKSGENK